MNHKTLASVIVDRRDLIRTAELVERHYDFEPNANYVLTGLRRAGKSMLMYHRVLELVSQGVDWSRIVYVDFEDERLSEFSASDFNDILLVQRELSDAPGFFFLDEVQNVAGWEKFARRLADARERVWITGSNAKMLSSEIATTLGGRFLDRHVTPYRFDEYLRASSQVYDRDALLSTRERGRILGLFDRYLRFGGLPESLSFRSPQPYIESVYQKVLLGDVAARAGVRNVQALRVLMKKVAETVRSDVSYSTLHGMLKSVGFSVGKDTVIAYLDLAREAFLLFDIHNAVAKFAEREGSPKYYFSDNGLLGLVLQDRDPALLEIVVACALHDVYGDGLCYLKSAKTAVDIDFYVPEASLAVQVAYSIAGEARKREVGNLVRLAHANGGTDRLVIVTREEEESLDVEDVHIEVVPAWRFLLEVARGAQ